MIGILYTAEYREERSMMPQLATALSDELLSDEEEHIVHCPQQSVAAGHNAGLEAH